MTHEQSLGNICDDSIRLLANLTRTRYPTNVKLGYLYLININHLEMERILMKKLLLLGMAIGLSACTYQLPISNPSGTTLQAILPADKYTIMGTASGEACARFILGFPLATATGEKSTYQAAVRKAILAKNGDHFIQSTSDFQLTTFIHPQYLPLYNELCVTVEGLVIKLKP